jgi:hypothetical protein
MYGPAVRCKRFVDLMVSGLASMYPVSSWSCFAPDHHGYQRACDLVNGQASTGHPGNQCSHAPGRPNLHLAALDCRKLETPDIDVLERAIRDPRVTVLDRIYDGYEKEVSPRLRDSAIVRLLDPATTP